MTQSEYNKLLAERVMGWEYTESFDPYHDERDCMRALEKMREKGYVMTWTTWPGTNKHRVELVSGVGQDHDSWHSATAPTLCAAACEAMREAVEED